MNFPWLEDEGGEYIVIRSDEVDLFEIRQETSVVFRYAGKLAMYNHIWIEMPELGETEETVMGVRMWQRTFDKKMGDGAFHELCDQMIEKGFYQTAEDEPSELDIQAYHATFGEEIEPEDVTETMIQKMMANFDSEWLYRSQEPNLGFA